MTIRRTTALPSNGSVNKLQPEDRSVHDWYRFVLSFPPHLVRDYLDKFGVDSSQRVLDPFCGTGTTIVECKKLGVPSVGIEAAPMAHLASSVKVDWNVDPDGLISHADHVAELATEILRRDGIEDNPVFYVPPDGDIPLRTLPPEVNKLLLKNSISPLPLHKTLVLLEALEKLRDPRYEDHERVALAKALVTAIGNLHFGPEVGIGQIKDDAPVVATWLWNVREMAEDLRLHRDGKHVPARAIRADARDVLDVIEPQSIDVVITSPPLTPTKRITPARRAWKQYCWDLFGMHKSYEPSRRHWYDPTPEESIKKTTTIAGSSRFRRFKSLPTRLRPVVLS